MFVPPATIPAGEIRRITAYGRNLFDMFSLGRQIPSEPPSGASDTTDAGASGRGRGGQLPSGYGDLGGATGYRSAGAIGCSEEMLRVVLGDGLVFSALPFDPYLAEDDDDSDDRHTDTSISLDQMISMSATTSALGKQMQENLERLRREGNRNKVMNWMSTI